MKTYEFEFNCDKNTAVEEILHDVKKAVLMFEENAIYGKAAKDKNRIILYNGIDGRNSFRPVFSAKVIENDYGKTVIRGHFRFHIYTIIFSIVWFSVLLYGLLESFLTSSTADVEYVVSFALFFSLAYVLFCVFGIALGRKNKKKVIDHIKMHQRIINNK